MPGRLTKKQYIEKCKDKFPEFDYDYSKVKYKNMLSRITIKCNTHETKHKTDIPFIISYKESFEEGESVNDFFKLPFSDNHENETDSDEELAIEGPLSIDMSVLLLND